MSDDTPVRPDEETVVRNTPLPPAGPLTETTRPSGAASPKHVRGLPAPGETFGPYIVLRTLGSGGMGTVFEAEEAVGGRRVALKVLSREIASEEMRKRFQREGRLAASISHPNTVYVFGTEEIDGLLTISMELVGGGTLQDRVHAGGPMPVGEAVDAILQVVAGLEAAARAGVLHRDVKPSNCFVDSDGMVKVGDFGLSVSVVARGETQLTTAGTFLGTPAYSSPEQLRGDELDLRADIYSVGATLYTLLTARAPFDADNMVNLLAQALEKPPVPPDRLRRDLPRGLGKAVLRCLEKRPDRRFATYEDLRRALAPFSAASPTAAPLGTRFFAGAIDLLIVGVPMAVLPNWRRGSVATMEDFSRMPMRQLLLYYLFLWSGTILYFAIPEGLWGASLGKALCRLRVTRANRLVPGMARSIGRALLYVLLPAIPLCIYLAMVRSPGAATWASNLGTTAGMGYYGVLALLFSTARRHNGNASLHDLATGTRVTLPPSRVCRPGFSVPAASVDPAPARIGPYEVAGAIQGSEGQWLVGTDTRLGRAVWIRPLPPDAPPEPTHDRSPVRAGRLRWLLGRRGAREAWDAYEAPSGAPLLRLLDRPHEWESVRWWALDLGEEMSAAANDGSLPPVLGLDRVWITADGRAKLLHLPAPSAGRPPGPWIVPADPYSLTLFLAQVCRSALEGRPVRTVETAHPPSVPLALHARAWVEGLRGDSLGAALSSLRPLLHRTASVTWRRKLGLLAACLLLPALEAAFLFIGLRMQRNWAQDNPDVWPMRSCLEQIQRLSREEGPEAARQKRQIEVFIAGRYRGTISDSARWNGMFAMGMIQGDLRREAERIVAEIPAPSEAEVKEAEAVAAPCVAQGEEMTNAMSGLSSDRRILVVTVTASFSALALLAMFCALFFRGGLVLLVLGLAFVRRDGAQSGRWRLLLRQVIAWSPLFFVAVLWGVGHSSTGRAAAGALVTLSVLGSVVSICARRGIADHLAGTWMVRR